MTTQARTWRSQRIAHLTQSEIRRMTRECTRLGGINMGQGICDLPTPPEILSAAAEAILADKFSTYSKFEGLDELREQLAIKSREFNKIEVDPASELVVTIGATGALTAVVQSLFDPGDEIIVFEPYYGYHVNTLRVGGVVPVFVTLRAPEWTIRREDIEAVITERTRALLFSNPTNPSGKVYSREELEIIGTLCAERGLLAITDEIYEYIVNDGAQHISLASLPGMRDHTITMSGFSKTFSITGWRLGTITAPAALAAPIGLINDLFYVCAPTPLQYALARGIATIPASYYTQMALDYQAKRDFFCDALFAANLPPIVPRGAYYVLTDVSRLGCPNSKAAAMHILENAGVASVAGSAFYSSGGGEHLVRFCYAKDWDTLKRAASQLSKLA